MGASPELKAKLEDLQAQMRDWQPSPISNESVVSSSPCFNKHWEVHRKLDVDITNSEYRNMYLTCT